MPCLLFDGVVRADLDEAVSLILTTSKLGRSLFWDNAYASTSKHYMWLHES
jgi:hypothetical protein